MKKWQKSLSLIRMRDIIIELMNSLFSLQEGNRILKNKRKKFCNEYAYDKRVVL